VKSGREDPRSVEVCLVQQGERRAEVGEALGFDHWVGSLAVALVLGADRRVGVAVPEPTATSAPEKKRRRQRC
jgi:hypothetical protein